MKGLILKDLYLSSGVELALDTLPREEKQSSATVQHSTVAEAAFAEAFLGKADVQESGSSMLYSSELGAMRLRRNSAFELNMYGTSLSLESTLQLLEDLGYISFPHRNRTSSAYLTQTVGGLPVVGSTVTLHFSDSCLTSAVGYYITAVQEGESVPCYSAADALAAFLQYGLDHDFVYSTVLSIEPAWQLSAETLFQSTLLPAWVIKTDSNFYYVNHNGSEIAPVQPDNF